MEVLATALGVDEDHDARTAAILCIEVTGEGLELAHGIDAQVGVFAVVRSHIGIDHAVEEEIVGGPAHSVYVKIVCSVKNQPELRVIVREHAGERGHQRFEVSTVQRLLGHLALINDGCVA